MNWSSAGMSLRLCRHGAPEQSFCTGPKLQNPLGACKLGGSREVVENCPFLTLFFRSERRLAARPSRARACAKRESVRDTNAFFRRERRERAGGGRGGGGG